MTWWRSCLALVLAPALVAAAPEDGVQPAPSPREAKERWQGRLDGIHFSARMKMSFERGEDRGERVVDVWRDDGAMHEERLMARFDKPSDLRGLGILYLENEGRPNDYFLYQPATGRVRRVPEALAREDIYGVDLEYLGFGVAHIERTRVRSVIPTQLEGSPMLRLTEEALSPNPRFDTRVVWLDPLSFVPVRTEHQHRGRTTLIARTVTVREIQGIPTPTHVIFHRPLEQETVEMAVEHIDYRKPIPGAFFSTLNLLKR